MNNSLAEVHPELVSEWSEKNLLLTPDDITFGSNKKVWWKGACSHEWQTSVKARSSGEKCPICAGARVIVGINDLATLEPLLVCLLYTSAVVEARIADLEATLKIARIMDDSDLSLDTVSIGMHVRILAEGDEPDEAEEYDITGSTEADIDQGRISDESPVGAALIGHKAGDKVDVTLPNGNILEYTILGVSRSR